MFFGLWFHFKLGADFELLLLEEYRFFIRLYFLPGSDLSLGNKLLVYISCCLAGQGYPVGSIPEDLAQEVKRKV